jgi:FMN phosphatase YigB (HAD superfamily)
VKPDPRIYRVFCERYALAPESCVFIDDSEPNIIAARKFGMKGVLFTSPEQARRELIELGLPLKPEAAAKPKAASKKAPAKKAAAPKVSPKKTAKKR